MRVLLILSKSHKVRVNKVNLWDVQSGIAGPFWVYRHPELEKYCLNLEWRVVVEIALRVLPARPIPKPIIRKGKRNCLRFRAALSLAPKVAGNTRGPVCNHRASHRLAGSSREPSGCGNNEAKHFRTSSPSEALPGLIAASILTQSPGCSQAHIRRKVTRKQTSENRRGFS